jgi:hypothetical protein
MDYETLIVSYITLPLIGLIIYWYGLFFCTYLPFKCKKEEIYQYGILFVLFHIVAPLLVSVVIIYPISTIQIKEINLGILLVSIVLYFISGFTIPNLNKEVSTAQKNNFNSFLNKTLIEKKLEKLPIWCWVNIITTSIIFYITTIKMPNQGMLTLSANAAIILATLIVMSMASSLFGYKETSFPPAIIKLKDNYVPIKAIITRHDEYILYFDGQRKVKIKEDSIESITYTE